MTITQSVWRDQRVELRGMANFSRWRISQKQMQDIDGLVHNKANNRFLMVEFKPPFQQVTKGQEITMMGFSKLPGCTALVIYDHYYLDASDTPYDQDDMYKVIWYRDGKADKAWMRLGDLNKAMDAELEL